MRKWGRPIVRLLSAQDHRHTEWLEKYTHEWSGNLTCCPSVRRRTIHVFACGALLSAVQENLAVSTSRKHRHFQITEECSTNLRLQILLLSFCVEASYCCKSAIYKPQSAALDASGPRLFENTVDYAAAWERGNIIEEFDETDLVKSV
jgi:hypothetical protein